MEFIVYTSYSRVLEKDEVILCRVYIHSRMGLSSLPPTIKNILYRIHVFFFFLRHFELPFIFSLLQFPHIHVFFVIWLFFCIWNKYLNWIEMVIKISF